MDVSIQSYIDPLISLFDVEKLSEINLTVDNSQEENKKKEPTLTRERKEAYNDLIAAFIFVQDKVASGLKKK
jgi:hypothetical protein